jgi:hypothetical protein
LVRAEPTTPPSTENWTDRPATGAPNSSTSEALSAPALPKVPSEPRNAAVVSRLRTVTWRLSVPVAPCLSVALNVAA